MVAWKELNQGEKDHVLALLAVWTTLRKALIHGSELDRKHALSIINSAAPQGAQNVDIRDWLQHLSTLQIYSTMERYWIWSPGYRPSLL